MKYDYLASFLLKIPHIKKFIFPIGLNVDVTKHCNLKCKHCYFQHQNQEKELSIEDWLKKLEKIKKSIPTIVSVDWIGGEPLLRKELIEKGKKYFPVNTIITNGTIPLPKWDDCIFLVSIDGTKEYHERTRKKDIYEKIKKNIDRDDIDVYINFTINSINVNSIEAFLEEWSKTKVQGVLFTFCTPIKGASDDLSLEWEKRDLIVEQIIELKRKYKDFILNLWESLDLMKSGKAKKVLENCVFRKKAFISLDAEGKTKTPCSMGQKANCSKCGCIVPYLFYFLQNKEIEFSPNYNKSFEK